MRKTHTLSVADYVRTWNCWYRRMPEFEEVEYPEVHVPRLGIRIPKGTHMVPSVASLLFQSLARESVRRLKAVGVLPAVGPCVTMTKWEPFWGDTTMESLRAIYGASP